jgi:hypothetical protein
MSQTVAKRNILMQSIPNSGSTWLGQLIVDTLGLRHFEGLEYFNPVRNERFESELDGFGLETIQHYQNITSDGAGLGPNIAATWGTEDYEFTKEVWSPMKTELFHNNGFQVIVLLRPTYGRYGTFPPSRQRALGFYEHAWHALRIAEFMVDDENRTRARAEAAHRFLLEGLRQDVQRLGLTSIHYERLAEGDVNDVRRELAPSFNADDADALAVAIVNSRRAAVKGEG